jgi:hypothetical protein
MEGIKDRFLGYGPGRLFEGTVAEGIDTSLNLPTTFEDDSDFDPVSLTRRVGLCSCTVDNVVSHSIPRVDGGVVEINDMWGDIGWDGYVT